MSEAMKAEKKFDATAIPSFYTNPKIAEIVAASLTDQDEADDKEQREARVQEVRDNIIILLKRPVEEKTAELRKELKKLQAAKKDVRSLMVEYQKLQNKLAELDKYWD
jgi:hypothetical protein